MDGLTDSVQRFIDGVFAKRLVMHPDSRGRLFEILRCDDEIFQKFGQVYLTSANPGIIKAWHYHKLQTDYFCCIAGSARLVLYDSRYDSPTSGLINEFLVGPENLVVVTIPPLVYHGFQCVSETEAVMINIPTLPYNAADPDEYRLDPHSDLVPYTWPETPHDGGNN